MRRSVIKPLCLATGLWLAAAPGLPAQSTAGYQVHLDLQQVPNDRVKVVVHIPPVQSAQVTYVMPAVVPGTYKQDDFGRFVHDFGAFDRQGRRLNTRREGPNRFVIANASALARLEYWVEDTWDAPQDAQFVVQAGGTNFDAGRNFIINHFGLYGYLEGYKLRPYSLTVTRPPHLHGATSLAGGQTAPGHDVFTAPDYVALADAPILYSPPDTAAFTAGGARISVAVFSENGLVKVDSVAGIIRPMAEALARFFGKMPVPRYQFLMYFFGPASPVASQSGNYGALEHAYSSLYYLPETDRPDSLRAVVRGLSSHEFLHILTPLNIHSREIGDFDFRRPRMSAHLWLYEGVTEYFTDLVQLRGGLITREEFRRRIGRKIVHAGRFPAVSFTKMSRNILREPYRSLYPNVYQKGALLGFLLDIRIQELTGGQSSLRQVLLTLAQRYGPDRSFEDARLIGEIVSLTHPQVRQFFDHYVTGRRPLPYPEYFAKIGWRLEAPGTVTERGEPLPPAARKLRLGVLGPAG